MNVPASPVCSLISHRRTNSSSAVKLGRLVLVGLAFALLATGCKPKEVTSLARAQANQLAIEAQGSILLRDYAAAEKALTKAVELDPDVVGYWSALGVNRIRLGDKSGARKAYKRMLAIHEKAYKKDSKNVDALLNQIEPLVLLGRADDARKLLEKAGRDHAGDPSVRSVNEGKIIDRMLEDPRLKASILER